jgi:Glycolipid transfer protein (GLTP)
MRAANDAFSIHEAGWAHRLQSLISASASMHSATLAARVQSNTVTKKNSLARNLHRLRTVVVFMEKIMDNLAANAATTLSTAVSSAYAETLALYHSFAVRTTCNAGFLVLPNRTSFLASLGETGAARVI